MRYVGEHEVACDADTLGFPSISGCIAIVYVANGALFGYHCFGGFQQAARATGFANYINAHFLKGPGTRLYGVTFASGSHSRGYGTNGWQDAWKTEVQLYAAALGYTGKIRGYDLANSGAAGSAYVEFRRTVDKCEIWVKQWNSAHETKGANTSHMNHKYLHPTNQALQMRMNVTTAVAGPAPMRVHTVNLA